MGLTNNLRILTLLVLLIVVICISIITIIFKERITMKAALKVRKQEIKGTTYFVKLRIDAKTVITVRTKESLKNWKTKYPDAIELA